MSNLKSSSVKVCRGIPNDLVCPHCNVRKIVWMEIGEVEDELIRDVYCSDSECEALNRAGRLDQQMGRKCLIASMGIQEAEISDDEYQKILAEFPSLKDILSNRNIKDNKKTKIVPKLDNVNWDSRAYDSLSRERDEY